MSREHPMIKVTLCNDGKSGGKPKYLFLSEITGYIEDTYKDAKGWRPGCSIIWVNTSEKKWRVTETCDELDQIIPGRLRH